MMNNPGSETPGSTDWPERFATAVSERRWRVVATLLKAVAPPLALTGQFQTLHRWISVVPESQLQRDPQLLFWFALSLLLQNPAEARPGFIRAFELFEKRGNTRGAWGAWAGVADATMFVYRDLREMDVWIAWITGEREAVLDRMLKIERAPVVFSVFFLLCFRQPNHPRMEVWRTRVMRLIEEDPASDMSARLTLALVTDCLWRGNLAEAEIAHKRFHACRDPERMSPMIAVLAHVMDATYYLHSGQMQLCTGAIASGLQASASAGVNLWDGVLHCHGIANHCSQRNIPAARIHVLAIEKLMRSSVPIDEGYFRGMRMWLAFTEGNYIGIVSECDAGQSATDIKGVPYLSAASRIGTALVLHSAGATDRAWQLLHEAEATASDLGNPLLSWMAGLFSAHMHYADGQYSNGDQALTRAMQLGAQHGFSHFFCWPRQIIAELIDRCFHNEISVEYAAWLAARHALRPPRHGSTSDRWSFQARLYTLGPASVRTRDDVAKALASNTPKQAELIAGLIRRGGARTPMQTLAEDIYADEEKTTDVVNSLKQLINSLRQHLGEGLVRSENTLAFDFERVWVDACALQAQIARRNPSTEIEKWLRRHYRGHFMEGSKETWLVGATRARLRAQAAQAIRTCRDEALRTENKTAHASYCDHWADLFPELFS